MGLQIPQLARHLACLMGDARGEKASFDLAQQRLAPGVGDASHLAIFWRFYGWAPWRADDAAALKR